MIFQPLSLQGLVLITPDVHPDERGFFLERYNRRVFREQGGIDIEFVQDNHSRSSRGVLRGIHFQLPPYAQDKLVWVTQGEVLDVAVDLRRESPTFGQWNAVTLSEANHQMFLVPKGFGHAFLVLSETVDFQYKTSDFYAKSYERGIAWNDPQIGIDWPVSAPILSGRDLHQPSLAETLASGDLF